MTDTITIATWEQATDGRRDTNPFDHVEAQLVDHHERVGLYDVVRSYTRHVAECLPQHIDFVDNKFVAPSTAVADPDSEKDAIRAAIREADRRHGELVRSWIS